MHFRLSSLLLIAVFIVLLSPLAITRANATIIVNTAADEDNTGPNCSLREAITAANTNANYGGCKASGAYGTDTITFAPTVFSTAQTIHLFDRLPDITSGMSIKGPGANLLTISGENQNRPFYINVAAAVTLSDMTITQGMADFGGGVDVNYGFVTLQNVVVRDSFATQQGGGVMLINGADPDNPLAQGTIWVMNSTFFGNSAQADGGAIYTAGTIIASNTTISGNSAGNSGSGNGGAIQSEASGVVTLINVTASGNFTNGTGGGYNGDGTLTLRNSILANSNSGGDCNSSVSVDMQNSLIEDGSCGITNGQNGNLTGDPMLGGLGFYGGPMMTMLPAYNSPVMNAGNSGFVSEATLNLDLNGDGDKTDTLTTDQRGTGYPRVNYAAVDMGADELSLNVPASLVVDTTSDADLHDCTSAANDCSLRGAISLTKVVSAHTITFDSTVFAAPQTITLTSALPGLTGTVTIDGGTDGHVTVSGGGLTIRVFTISSGATVTLENLTVSDGNDGGILNAGTLILQNMTIHNNTAVNGGGGIYNTAMLRVLNSTITGNSAQAGGGLRNASTMIVVNSTITGNSVSNFGGGIDNGNTMTLVNSTVTGNSSSNANGGISNIGLTVNLYNTIVANNFVTGANAGNPQFDVECNNGGMPLQTFNTLIKDGSCLNGTGNLTGDPMLNALANNGGLTQTFLPQSGSPVINAGNNSYLSEATLNLDLNGDGDKTDTLSTDQRGTGYPRVSDTTVDMGTVETAAVVSPANAAPAINYTTANVVTLTWNRLNGATSYEVQVSLSSAFTVLQCGGSLQAGSSLYISTCTLTPGTYYWRVRGKSASAPDAWSAAIPFTIGIP